MKGIYHFLEKSNTQTNTKNKQKTNKARTRKDWQTTPKESVCDACRVQGTTLLRAKLVMIRTDSNKKVPVIGWFVYTVCT